MNTTIHLCIEQALAWTLHANFLLDINCSSSIFEQVKHNHPAMTFFMFQGSMAGRVVTVAAKRSQLPPMPANGKRLRTIPGKRRHAKVLEGIRPTEGLPGDGIDSR
jgi:hypothetical protein